jgi:hypothetical protein
MGNMGMGFQSPFDLFQSFFGSNNNPFDDPFFTQGPSSSLFGSNDPFDDPFFTQGLSSSSSNSHRLTGSGGRQIRNHDPFGQFNSLFGHGPMLSSSSSSSVNTGRHHHHRGGRMANSTSTSTRTRVINGHRETVTEVRDGQGNVRVETETVDSAGRREKRVVLNGIEQPSAASSSRGRRIHIS